LTVSRQLLLDLGTPPPETFDNFVAGPNAELVARLDALRQAVTDGPPTGPLHDAAGALASRPERVFYIWGDAGSGRSHLLHALCHAAPERRARLLVPNSPLSSFVFDPEVALYAIDDCDRLPPARQIAAFNLFNEVRASSHVAFVATGGDSPMALTSRTIRDDLRTRLGWGLVYRLAPLSDDDKITALAIAARERGLMLAADVPPYLLNHFQRDMPSLKSWLDALEQFSLERKRPITLPLLRAMLAGGDGNADMQDNHKERGKKKDEPPRNTARAGRNAGKNLAHPAANPAAGPAEPSDPPATSKSPRPDRPGRIK
jgi:DnaA family protein